MVRNLPDGSVEVLAGGVTEALERLGGALRRGASVVRGGRVPMRKPGKLPAERGRVEYALEYGTDALEMHTDAVTGEDRVLIVDDVLATGGTAAAAARLVRTRGGEVVGFTFLIELDFLKG